MNRTKDITISVFGLGYVGAVTAACLCKSGYRIIGVDVSESKVRDMKQGLAPIFERGLGELLEDAVGRGDLQATSDHHFAVMNSDVSIVCVGTPSLESGRLNLAYVHRVCGDIAAALMEKEGKHLLLLRSTMLPGSTRSIVANFFLELIATHRLEVVYCPEFLREGNAIFDFNHPALSVLGSQNGDCLQSAEDLMGTAHWFSWEGAEMIKYGCNYWHALKVGFANEMGRICKHSGVDAKRLMETLVADEKLNISSYYMRPGNPFGGSCLPKDVSALSSFSRQAGVNLPLLDSVMSSNQAHLDSLLRLVIGTGKKSVLILGITFKDNTDDLRGSPMVALAETLLGRGMKVRVYDPNLDTKLLQGSNREQILRRVPHLAAMLTSDLSSTVKECEVLVVAHKNVSLEELRPVLSPLHHVVDVNGWAELRGLPCQVEGLCW